MLEQSNIKKVQSRFQ